MLYFALTLIVVCGEILADSSCTFQHPTKGAINLSSVGLRTGQARFHDIASPVTKSYAYSFNPCYSFSERECQHVAACQIELQGQRGITLGTQNNSKWTVDEKGVPILTYRYDSKSVSIRMICSQQDEDELEVFGESAANQYQMALRSPCACWDGCFSPKPHPRLFRWTIWMTMGVVGAVFACMTVTMITCVLCSKPSRNYRSRLPNERTSMIKGTINYRV